MGNINFEEVKIMWKRKDLKKKAKEVLKNFYWKSFLISFVIMLIGGNQHYNFLISLQPLKIPDDVYSTIMSSANPNLGLWFYGVIVSIIFLIFFMPMRVFIGYILEIGGRKFYINASKEEGKVKDVISFFKKDTYFNIIKTMLVRDISIFLWSLLFVIPGVIKAYTYRMVPYILAHNPSIDYKRALELSKLMTDGHKFEIIKLDLSFFFWHLLGIIVSIPNKTFIGIYFIYPYIEATDAQLYNVLRRKLFEKNLCSADEIAIKE